MTTLITGPLDTLGSAPDPLVDQPPTFSTKAAAIVLAIKTMVTQLITIISQINTVTTEVNTNATNAATNATAAAASAASAAATAGVVLWVSGSTYAAGVCVYSPINSYTYRRTSNSAGSSTTDPSADAGRWVSLVSTPNVGSLISLYQQYGGL